MFLYNLKKSEAPYTDILIDQEELDTVNVNDLTRHISFREKNSDKQNTTTLSENDKDISNSTASQYEECDISLSEDELAINKANNSEQIHDYVKIHNNTLSSNLDDMSDDELAFSTAHNSNIAIDPITYTQAIVKMDTRR